MYDDPWKGGNTKFVSETESKREDLMMKYTQKVLVEFPEELRGTSSTPDTDHTFQVRGEYEAYFLEEDRDEMFHH